MNSIGSSGVLGNSFKLAGAEEADEVAAAGGERLPDAAGVEVFQVNYPHPPPKFKYRV